jgi:mannose-6-phosphate isomerase-like protein (cupin superfamily)
MARADAYDLMMTESDGPRRIPFNHVNTRDETVVMISGNYSTRIGTQRVQVNTGDVLVIPRGVPHGDIETGPGGYKVLQIENNLGEPPAPRLNALA